jgi:hypothetical protein
MLRLTLGVVAARSLPWRARAQRELRIVLVGAHEPALIEAVTFGVGEAARSAEPFGLSVSFARVADAGEVAAPGASAALALLGGATPSACADVARLARARGALYVDAWCGAPLPADACGAWIARVAPSPAMRVDAIGAGGAAALGATRWRVDGGAGDPLAARAARALAGGGATVVRDASEPHDAVLRVGATPDARRASDGARLEARAWHPSLEAYGAGQLGPRFRLVTGRDMDERAWAAWVAAKLVAEAALRAAADERIAARIARPEFIVDGHKGVPLFVRAADRQLAQPLYLVRASADGREEVAATVPRPGAGARARLDAFGLAGACGGS